MVTMQQIVNRTGLESDKIRTLLSNNNVFPGINGKYSPVDLERVFDENFKVRVKSSSAMRTMKIHQK